MNGIVPKIITLIIISNISARVETEFKLPNTISALQGRDPHATLVFFNPIFFFPKVPNCFCLTEKQRNVRDVAKILNKIISNLKQSTEFHSLKSELKLNLFKSNFKYILVKLNRIYQDESKFYNFLKIQQNEILKVLHEGFDFGEKKK